MASEDRSNPTNTDAGAGPLAGQRPRRAYQSPILRVYGDLATITKAVGFKGLVADGGTVLGMRKTH